ncbi:DUF6397 family protein [Streptomyces sp. NRRL F-5126]|uniref:DUF6397 family protein n=1 Tax=Streptomyces sp. NRRL F-5126 TaxID=1463857 RepID=UPI0006925E80|nr:DUF6397 family protein [Streptomyces sp. NRRL F-5126]
MAEGRYTKETGTGESVGADRAARELGLKRGELTLAVELGHVRAADGSAAARIRVPRGEIDRLRAAGDFPDALRERVLTMGTARGAELMGISPGRFTRLARAGLLTPVRFFLNRYRTIVWLYLAEELRALRAAEPLLLLGRLPERLRTLADGGDRRACNWRSRRVSALLRDAAGPWERVAAAAAALEPAELARLLPDPGERERVAAVTPELAHFRPTSDRAAEVVRALVTAEDPDEAAWYAANARALLAEARESEPAPRARAVPAPYPRAAPAAPEGAEPPVPAALTAEGAAASVAAAVAVARGPLARAGSASGLLGRLRGRRRGAPSRPAGTRRPGAPAGPGPMRRS